MPFIHGYEPGVALLATGEVDDEFVLVVVEGFEDGLEARKGEIAVGEEEGCDYDLPRRDC